MAIDIHSDHGIILPQDWDISEQESIDDFFSRRVPQVANTATSADECHNFANSILPGCKLQLVNNQGWHSYTLICPDRDTIIQFRMKKLNTAFIDEARQIHSDLVAQVTYHPGFTLPVYTSSVIPGVAHIWLEPSREDFPLERELNTVRDLANFFAKPSHTPHPVGHYSSTSKTFAAPGVLARLSKNSDLEKLAPYVYQEILSTKDKLHLLQSLPPVLSHPDLVGLNVFVASSDGHITGVIDFDNAGVEALGVNIVTLYEDFLGSMNNAHWTPFDTPAGEQYENASVARTLEQAFWTAFWDSLSPSCNRREHEEAISVAVKVGIINRYFVDGMILEEINSGNVAHMRSLDFAKGIFGFLRGPMALIEPTTYN